MFFELSGVVYKKYRYVVSLGPYINQFKTHNRFSVQPFLQGSYHVTNTHRHRHTDHATSRHAWK